MKLARRHPTGVSSTGDAGGRPTAAGASGSAGAVDPRRVHDPRHGGGSSEPAGPLSPAPHAELPARATFDEAHDPLRQGQAGRHADLDRREGPPFRSPACSSSTRASIRRAAPRPDPQAPAVKAAPHPAGSAPRAAAAHALRARPVARRRAVAAGCQGGDRRGGLDRRRPVRARRRRAAPDRVDDEAHDRPRRAASAPTSTTCSAPAAYRPAAVESQIGLRTGERMSVRDLLRATLLPSANDAAATIAVGTMGSSARS